jgi:pyrroline-5-carboxylate reductase
MKKITIVGLGNMGLNFINSVNKDFKKNISDIEINSLLLIPKELDKDFIINNIQKNHQYHFHTSYHETDLIQTLNLGKTSRHLRGI